MSSKKAYLVKVEAGANNNKFYDMSIENGQLISRYGRVGTKGQIRRYSESLFDKKFREKLRKGYTDHTAKTPTSSHLNLTGDEQAIQFLEQLKSLSSDSFSKNYTIDPSLVTKAKVEEAQQLLNKMLFCTDENCFNDYLVTIFSIFQEK